MKKSISCCLSHQNPATYLFRAVLDCFGICADFSPDSDQTTFSLEEALLWIMDSYFSKKKVLMDLFLTNTQICLLKMLTNGLEWCGLLWCFYQLFGLSFWRHPFTAEHPLLRQWCNATFLQIWWRNKLIYILDGLRMSYFQQIFIFFVNYSFKAKIQRLPACAKHFFKLRLLLLFVSLAISQQCALSSCKGLKAL